MKTDNKQNTAPNKIFSNSYLNTKIIKPNSEQHKKPTITIDVNTNQNKNIQAVLQQKNNGSNVSKLICGRHNKQFNNLFCSQCLSYNICRSCISASHGEHQVMQFGSHEELIAETKEILLENLEQTLKQLKSKQNQVKNRTHEINLIRNSLRSLQEEMVSAISSLFKDIQTELIATVEKKQQEFNKQIDGFFGQFNDINEELRDNLMKILDGDINIVDFNKNMVKRSPPQCPNFQNYKSSLEKYKKIYKDVKIQLVKVKKLVEQSINNPGANDSTCRSMNRSNTLSKFDKYFQNSMQKKEKVNPSFMKTLRLLEPSTKFQQNLMKIDGKHTLGQGDGNKKSI